MRSDHEANTVAPLPKGEAVALGLVAVTEVAEALGLSPLGTAHQVRHGLQLLDLPTQWQQWATPKVMERLDLDKKRDGSSVALVTLAELGRAECHSVAMNDLRATWLLLAERATARGA